MQTQRTNPSNTEVKMIISANEADLKPIKDQVVARLSQGVKLPGFRSGKAPQALIEKNLDQNLLQGDFLDEAMTQLYARATSREKIRPVTRPEVTVKKFVPFTELEFEVKAGVVAKIELPDYKKIKVKAEPVSVTAKDVNEVLESLKTRLADKDEVKRPAKNGDEVMIDFVGKDTAGKPIESADGKDYPLLLGSKAFIPGFEEGLAGTKAGDEKVLKLTFPKEYGATQLAGKKVNFTVKVKAVAALVKPEVDDAFAAKVGPFKTAEELKSDIKKQLTAEKERESRANHQEAVLKAVSDKTKLEMPQTLVDEQISHNLEHARRDATQKGQTFQELLKVEGKTEENFKKDLEPGAREQLKASLLLAEVAEQAGLEVTAEEVEHQIGHLKEQYKDEAMQAELDKPENRKDIASRILSEKTVNYLIEQTG